VLLQDRGDDVKGVNLGGSFDVSCHRLQHLRIGIAVVVVGVFLVVPQTDHDHINSAVTPGVASHAFVPRSLWPQALIASVLCILVLQLLSV